MTHAMLRLPVFAGPDDAVPPSELPPERVVVALKVRQTLIGAAGLRNVTRSRPVVCRRVISYARREHAGAPPLLGWRWVLEDVR